MAIKSTRSNQVKHEIELTPVKYTHPEHQAAWLEVRTDPTVHSITRNPAKRSRITKEEHYRWWMASAVNVRRRLFLINDLVVISPVRQDHTGRVLAGTKRPIPIGILRLDRREDWTEIWLALKSPYRGRGVGRQAVLQAQQIVQNLRWPPLGAVIHAQKNLPAWRLFIASGFLVDQKGFIKVQLPSLTTRDES